MGAPVTIALDAMGGDHGPGVVIPAAAISLVRHPDMQFLLVGDTARIEPVLAAHPALAGKARIIHTDVAVAMDAKPSQALRKGRYRSSMWLALEAVKDGRADAAVSAGNTGALMVMAKFCLKTHRRRRSPGDRRASGRPSRPNASCSMSAPMSAPMPASSSSSR